MKKEFLGFYRPTESEFDELWEGARIVVDANVLLTVYGVSPSTRETLLRLLEAVKDRLWIPNHFALEYQRNRVAKILAQVRHYEDAHRNLRTILDEQFRSRTQHPFVSEGVEKGLEEVCQSLLVGKTEQERLLKSDPHFLRTTELFEGRVGLPYGEPELVQAYEIARKRFSAKIPPGFKDSDKPEPARYGDYIGWRQILDFAIKTSSAVILVTDDAKEDWWRKEGSRTLGPHPDLVAEFRVLCSRLFYMYSSDEFLELSGRYVGGPVDPSAVSELKERRASEPTGMKATEAVIPGPSAIKSIGAFSEPRPSEEKGLADDSMHLMTSVEKPEEK